jgi:hypothetical protein
MNDELKQAIERLRNAPVVSKSGCMLGCDKWDIAAVCDAAEKATYEGKTADEIATMWVRELARAEAAEARVKELEADKRSMGCGYCGHTFYSYPTDKPTDTDHEAALRAFVEHDAKCEHNPLAKRIAELEAAAVECGEVTVGNMKGQL